MSRDMPYHIPAQGSQNAFVVLDYGLLHPLYVKSLKGASFDELAVKQITIFVEGGDLLWKDDKKDVLYHFKSRTFINSLIFKAYVMVMCISMIIIFISFIYFDLSIMSE